MLFVQSLERFASKLQASKIGMFVRAARSTLDWIDILEWLFFKIITYIQHLGTIISVL